MTKAQVKKLVKKYAEKLHLSEWQHNIIFSKENLLDDEAVAEIKTDHRYKFFTITIYKEAFVPPNDIEKIIRHELCHCLTDPLYKYCYDFLNGKFRTHHDIEDQRELLTEWIAKLI